MSWTCFFLNLVGKEVSMWSCTVRQDITMQMVRKLRQPALHTMKVDTVVYKNYFIP